MWEAFMALASAPFIQFMFFVMTGACVTSWLVERK